MSKDLSLSNLQFFNRGTEYSVSWRQLPHWAQAGTVCFVTWRTADSLPVAAIRRLFNKRQELLLQFGFQQNADWKTTLDSSPLSIRTNLHWAFFETWDGELHNAAGVCWLREPELAEIVMKCLRHFDGDRYVLTDAVVMPNHVHLMVAFRNEESLLTQCTSWKRFTATQINRWLKDKGISMPKDGEFWQRDQFDHLVRGEEYFGHFRHYIRENAKQAGLDDRSKAYYSRA